MKKSDYLIKSFASAAGVLVYVATLAWLGFNSQNTFDNQPTFLVPLFMLLLFVVSAAITGLLVLGKPIHLYLNNKQKEAFIMLFATLGWLVIFLVAIVVILLAR